MSIQDWYEQVIRSIYPGLTFYAVVIAFSYLAFRLGKFFWEFESTLIRENVDRLRAVMTTFRLQRLEPVLRTYIQRAVHGAYEETIHGILADIYAEVLPTSSTARDQLIPDSDLRPLLGRSSMVARLTRLKSDNNSIEQFFPSSAGEEFYEALDREYQRQHTLSNRYHDACWNCSLASYSFYCVAVFLIAGLTQLIEPWPDFIRLLWFLICVQGLVLGFYFFIQMERNRRALLRIWDRSHLYGTIESGV